MRLDRKRILVGLFIGLLAVPAVAEAAGKVTYSDLSLMGAPAASKDDAHRETIEIASWSLGASNPAAYRGTTTVNQGILTFTASAVPASVARLCQSRAVLPSMTVEADGQRKVLRDVVFQDCPSGGTTGGTFTLTFNGQTTAAAAMAMPLQELTNVTISGLTRMKCSNNLKQIGLAAHGATIYVGSANGGVWKTTDGGPPAAGTQFPSVIIEGNGGTKVEFTKVVLKNVMISSAQGTQTIEIAFESTTATPQLVAALIAGR